MARKKAQTRKIVTVTPTINHDRMKRGRTYDLLLTDDVLARVESGALRIVDERTEPVREAPATTATTRRSSSSVTSDTAPATAQEGDDSDDRTDGADD